MVNSIITDDYHTVLNRDTNYKSLAAILKDESNVVIAWTDEKGTQLDVLLSLQPLQLGPLQRGLRGRTDLFVGVMGYGCHGFVIDRTQELHHGYVGEKLHMGDNSTTEALTVLLNGVIGELSKDE